ncbi:hypothetical protein MKL26_06520 [Streptococcus suis]|nr:hypothetical protein [Streptococcus suis]
MKTILRYFSYKNRYNIHRSINGLFYYLRKFPLIGKNIPLSIFKAYRYKSGMFLLLRLLSVPCRIVLKGSWLAIHVGIAVFWSNFLLENKANMFQYQESIWILGFLFWFIFVGYGYRFSKGFDPVISQSEREFMQHFGLSHSIFLQSQLFVEPILTSLYYIPSLFLFCIFSSEWIFLPVGLLTIPAGHFSGYAIHRVLFNHRIFLRRNSWQSWVVFLSSLMLYGLVAFFKGKLSTTWLLPLLIFQPILIWCSYRYLKSQTNHLEYLQYCMDESLQMDKKVDELTRGTEYTRQGLEMQNKLKLTEERDVGQLSGMTYLNALLFKRHRSILLDKVRFRISFLLAIFLSFETLRYFGHFNVQISNTDYLASLPFAFIIMYLGSMGHTVAQMVFVNCDVSMLHYPFYREAKTIISGFNYRFFQTIKLNFYFSGSLLLLLIVFTRGHLSFYSYLLTALLLTSLTALFSFHNLFIYYILQPFTKDMEVVNPIYRFLNGALYWIAYVNTQLRINSPLYTLTISLILLLYVGIGYIVLLKKAPKTFKLKS